jgi:hypothetical protein
MSISVGLKTCTFTLKPPISMIQNLIISNIMCILCVCIYTYCVIWTPAKCDCKFLHPGHKHPGHYLPNPE